MALKIYDKLKPQGDYPAVDAEDVLMPDGTRLSEYEFPSGSVSSWNDLTDKPFTEESGKTDILEEQAIAFSTGISDATLFAQGGLVVGENYLVSWDGTEYVCTGIDGSDMGGDDGSVMIGNLAQITGEDSGEPFLMGTVYYPEDDVYVLAIVDVYGDTSSERSYTVAIYQEGESVWKLNEESLPMEAIDARIEEYISAALEGDY